MIALFTVYYIWSQQALTERNYLPGSLNFFFSKATRNAKLKVCVKFVETEAYALFVSR